MKYRKVIFIDPGTVMGWAKAERTIGTPEEPRPPKFTSGTAKLPNEMGRRVTGFWNCLGDVVADSTSIIPVHPKAVFLAWEEAAFSRYPAASRMYGMWEGLLLLFCEQYKIPYMAVNQSTIKKFAHSLGYYSPRPPRPHRAKGEPVAAFKQRLKRWMDNGKTIVYDKKPRPRPHWRLLSSAKRQEHEIDAYWGLEYILTQLEKERCR